MQNSGAICPSIHHPEHLTLLNGAAFSACQKEERHSSLHIQIAGTEKYSYGCLQIAKPLTLGKGAKILIELCENFTFEANRQYKFQIVRGYNHHSPKIIDLGAEVQCADSSLLEFVRHHVSFDPKTGILTIVTGPRKL